MLTLIHSYPPHFLSLPPTRPSSLFPSLAPVTATTGPPFPPCKRLADIGPPSRSMYFIIAEKGGVARHKGVREEEEEEAVFIRDCHKCVIPVRILTLDTTGTT